MAEAEKKCGTCYWYGKDNRFVSRGECNWIYNKENKTPISMIYHLSYMFEHEGTHCECWLLKQSDIEGT